MKITLDRKADAVYIYLAHKKIAKTEELDNNTFVDYDRNGKVIGIEVLEATKRIPLKQLSKTINIKQQK